MKDNKIKANFKLRYNTLVILVYILGFILLGRLFFLQIVKGKEYRDGYLRAFDRMLKARKEARLPTEWRDARSVMMWWVGDNPDQLSLFGEPEYLRGACL